MKSGSLSFNFSQNELVLKKSRTLSLDQHKEEIKKQQGSPAIQKLPEPATESALEHSDASVPSKDDSKNKKEDLEPSFGKEKRNRKFTREEDEKLKGLVKTYGEGAWSRIAEEMEGRNRKQVRERYINFLKKDRVVSEFTPEEDTIILQYVQENGRKWSSVAELLAGRTPIMIKNRYYAKLRRNVKTDDKSKSKGDGSSIILTSQADSSTGELLSPVSNGKKNNGTLKAFGKEDDKKVSLERLKVQEESMKFALAELKERIERLKVNRTKTQTP